MKIVIRQFSFVKGYGSVPAWTPFGRSKTGLNALTGRALPTVPLGRDHRRHFARRTAGVSFSPLR
jgi:hypothetical protein